MSVWISVLLIIDIVAIVYVLLVGYDGLAKLALSLFRLADYAEALQNSPRKRQLSSDSYMPTSLILPDCDKDPEVVELVEDLLALDYPEYEHQGLDRDYFALIQAGKTQESQNMMEQLRPVILPKLEKVKSELGELKAIDEYIAHWESQVDFDAMEKAVTRQIRQKAEKWKEFATRPANQLMPYIENAGEEDLQQLFATWQTTPAGGKRLLEIKPAEWLKSTLYQGAFLIGPFERCGVSCVGIGLPGHTPTAIGDYGQIRTSVPVPKHTGTLVADFFVADTRIEDRYRNVRTLSLFVNGRPVWEQDIALDQRGQEWVTVDLTEIARGAEVLDFVFTVMEKQAVGHHTSTVFLGPLVLRETGRYASDSD